MTPAALAASLKDLDGWRRHLGAALLGGLAAMAMAPFHWIWALVPGFAGLFWLLDGSRHWRRSFAIGWWFGFGHFGAGLYWVAYALWVYPDQHAWMTPLALFGPAAGLGIVTGCVALAFHGLGRYRRGLSGWLLFAVLWAGGEWLRGWLFTGFPWNLVGTVWTLSTPMMQAAAYLGVLGLGLVTVLAATAPALITDAHWRWKPAAVMAAVLVFLWVAGEARLSGGDPGTVAGVRLRLVQPNIRQSLKWVPSLRQQHLQTQLDLARQPAADGLPPTHVIWAETAAPFFIANDPGRLAMVAAATPKGGLTILGAPRTTARRETPYKVWNSLHAIDDNGRVAGTYDKHHLVPFGEYMPFRKVLSAIGLMLISEDQAGFSAGPGPRTLRWPGLPPVSPLICYEVIFPDQVLDPADRPAWMLNLTNDAWYGDSPGPYQHFAQARLRAVEQGMPLVRVAFSGISGIIDGHGRVVARLGVGERGIIDGALPKALATPTPFGRFGDWILLVAVAMITTAALLGNRRAS